MERAGKPRAYPGHGYELRYRALDGGTWSTLAFDATTLTATLAGLMPATTYRIEMRAQNADGFGPRSALVPFPITTVAAAPTSSDFTKNTAPGIDLGFSESDFEFNDVDEGDRLGGVTIVTLPQAAHGLLKWQSFGHPQKPVAADQLIYDYELASLVFTPDPSFVGAASFTFTVVDQRFAPSTIHTATINVQDDGARFAETVPITRSIAENSSAGAPVGAAISASDPDGDTISYSLTGEEAAGFTIDAGGQIAVGQGVTLDYESGKTTYTMTVEIHDGKGPGGAGASTLTDAYTTLTVTVTDVNEAPPAPGGLIVVSDSPGTLTATWTAPETSGRPPVTGYGVEYRKSGDTDWNSHLDPSGGNTDTSTTIESLTQDVDYEVRVWAVNDEGPGGYVSASQNVSPTPRLLTIAVVSDPGDDGFYGLDEEVRIRATFNVDVTVTGRDATGGQPAAWPTLEVHQIGSSSVIAAIKTAELDQETADGGTTLDFTFTPVTGDEGTEGIQFPRNAISVPEGSTITSRGQNVTLANLRSPVDTVHRVDAVRPAVVGRPTFATAPYDGETYQFGEVVSLDVTFSEEVEVTGKPYFKLTLTEDGIRRLHYDSGSGTNTLRFSYTVAAADTGYFLLKSLEAIHQDADNLVRDLRGNVFDDSVQGQVLSLRVDGSRIINRAPSLALAGPLVFQVAERSAPGTAFGVALTASDPDGGDAIAYTLSGAGAPYFAVNSAGQLSVAPGVSLDYEALANNALPLEVTISDGRNIVGEADDSADDSLTVTVVVMDVTERPPPARRPRRPGVVDSRPGGLDRAGQHGPPPDNRVPSRVQGRVAQGPVGAFHRPCHPDRHPQPPT